jgi:hypothetical protein
MVTESMLCFHGYSNNKKRCHFMTQIDPAWALVTFVAPQLHHPS